MEATNEFELSSFAKDILKKYYSQKDSVGRPYEDVDDIINRIVMSIIPARDPRFRDLMWKEITEMNIVPSSPIWMNAGTDMGQLSACFVLPIEDSIPSIYETLKNSAIVHKSGGGTGFAFSRIREKGSQVKSTGNTASGPLSFMDVYNTSTNSIKQGGKRRGANMGCLVVNHPDIEEFIQCKLDDVSFTNFNISVGITDEFRKALEGRMVYSREQIQSIINLTDEKDKKERYSFLYPLRSPKDGRITKFVSATRIWRLIAECAWKHGDPGLLFLDTINLVSPTEEKIETTNPCGEIPLLPYESCNLTAINLINCVTIQNDKPEFNFGSLMRRTRAAVKFLNYVININDLPLEEIKKQTLSTRKIGVGVMGFGDVCYKLGIRYGSDECYKLATQIAKAMAVASMEESARLLFAYKSDSDYEGFLDSYKIDQDYLWASLDYANRMYDQSKPVGVAEVDEAFDKVMRTHPHLLNGCRLTAAPTGTTSIIAGVSGGIEPNFGLVYVRVVDGKDKYIVLNSVFEEYLIKHGYSQEEIANMAEDLLEKKSIKNCEWATDEMKNIFVCADDVSWEEHLRVMYAFQKFIDNSVSKTINLPFEATVDTVQSIYREALWYNLKGITIYRDRCRETQVLYSGNIDKTKLDSTAKVKQDTADNQVVNSPEVVPASVDPKSIQTGTAVDAPVACQKDRVSKGTPVNEHELGSAIEQTAKIDISNIDSMADDIHYDKRLPKPRVRVMHGVTATMHTGCGKLYVTVNSDQDGLAEVFTGESQGGCVAQSTALSKIISISLRSGVDPQEIIDQLSSVMCKAAERNLKSECNSCPDAIARVMRMVLDEQGKLNILKRVGHNSVERVTVKDCMVDLSRKSKQVEQVSTTVSKSGSTGVASKVADDAQDLDRQDLCPRCGAKFHHESGCVTCYSCGWNGCNS